MPFFRASPKESGQRTENIVKCAWLTISSAVSNNQEMPLPVRPGTWLNPEVLQTPRKGLFSLFVCFSDVSIETPLETEDMDLNSLTADPMVECVNEA